MLVPLGHVIYHPDLPKAEAQVAAAVAPVDFLAIFSAGDRSVRQSLLRPAGNRAALAGSDLVLDPLGVLVDIVTEVV